MPTERLVIDPVAPSPAMIQRAAAVIAAGGLVAFPTETVYGLGANALSPAAVLRIFAAKGRPATNPLIVHVADADEARRITTAWPESAERLARAFWPGPLSIVLPRQSFVPAEATAGLPTVAVRVPDHPITLALIRAAGVPLAAPSANPSNRVSATTANHVVDHLGDRVDLVLDGGAAPGGLESTVIDLSGDVPRLLRPGLIDAEQVRAVLGQPVLVASGAHSADAAMPAPGMLARHYSPQAHLTCVTGHGWREVEQAMASGGRVGWMPISAAPPTQATPSNVVVRPMPAEPAAYAQRLYAVLHEMDQEEVEQIILQAPPTGGLWDAIHDRLRRAAAPA